MIPVFKPILPGFDALEPFVRIIDETNIYSNFGPLNNSLISCLADRYSIDVENICLVSSGTSGLLACLSLLIDETKKEKTDVVVGVPAWSFIATAQVPFFLGVRVVFVDVDINGFVDPPDDLSLDILIVVSPFGEKLNYNYWEDYALHTNTKILFDCAAAFSTVSASNFPAVISSHATKGFSTCEGGFVISKDKNFIKRVRAFSNFGFNQSRISRTISLNLKISEICCAYGLAALNNEDKYLTQYSKQVSTYDRLFLSSHVPVKIFNSPFMRSTYNILIPSSKFSRDDIILKLLTEYGIESRDWWGQPLYKYPQFPFSTVEACSFPVADTLSKNILGLPMGRHINIETQRFIVNAIAKILN